MFGLWNIIDTYISCREITGLGAGEPNIQSRRKLIKNKSYSGKPLAGPLLTKNHKI